MASKSSDLATLPRAGMKAGTISDLSAAEEVVRQALDIAENRASVQLESVVVSLSSGRLGSERFNSTVELHGAVIERDIVRVLAATSHHSARNGRAVLHSVPMGFSIEGARGIRDPRAMLGRRLGVDMHMVTADVAAARNLMLIVERSHLDVEAMVGVALRCGALRPCRR